MLARPPQSPNSWYTQLAFGCVIVTAFASFVFAPRIVGQEWQVWATFGLGGLYAVLGVLGDNFIGDHRRPALAFYYLGQCAVLTTMLFVSPVRGFFFILVLPVASQSIFELSWKAATVVIAYLFGVCVGVIGYYYGTRDLVQVAIDYLAAFVFTVAFTIVAVRALAAKSRAEFLTAELAAANEKLRAHALQTEEFATVRERNRLAREIHDGVGHYLTVIKVQLDAAAALLPAQPGPAQTSVETAARLAGEALDDVRRSVGALRTDATRPPLAEALRQLASATTPPPGLNIEGTPRTLSAAVEHALYRCAQEGLTNIRKHAAATATDLILDFRDPARLRFSLLDNGRGATPAPGDPADKPGYGLRGLRERIELLGGTVVAGNRPGGGFALVVEVPA
ncbi:MAG TPA: sensor histidine kinase [Opitutaceae bacterium]|nr:sensor histidine kinase [Opitutaceae bacterium]